MSFRFKSRRTQGAISNPTKDGTGCLIPFGVVFGCAGLFFAYLMGREVAEDLGTYRWNEAPCELLSCEIKVEKKEKDAPFSIAVRYRYTVGGEAREGTRYRRDDDRDDDYTKLARARKKLLAAGDGALVAYVDPTDPASAILERQNLWLSALILLFPLPFILVGFGLAYGGLSAVRAKKKAKRAGNVASLSSANKKSASGSRIGAVVFGLLFLVGLGLAFPLGLKPIQRSIDAKSWTATPCSIIWSRVQRHEGDDSDTYSVDIFYQYQFAGETHRSNRYGFIGGSSSGINAKQDVVNNYPEGSQQTCYVNPDDPLEAVINPRLGLGILLGLIPLILLLIGGGGLFAIVRSGATPGATRSASTVDRRDRDHSALRGTIGDAADDPMAARVFQPAGRRIVAFFIALGVALFWNGIVSVFVWQVIDGFRRGNPEWFLAVFMIPFVVIGLGMVGAVVYTLMMQFNPKPTLTVTPGSPLIGGPLRVEWRLRSGSGRLRNLRLVLVGEEKATYSQGTRTNTDCKTFYRRVLAEASHGIDLIQGEGRIDLPPDLCPSLDLGNNEIEWTLKVEGEIPRWPDVDDSYVIELRQSDSRND